MLIAVGNKKGGVGKSTLATNFAVEHVLNVRKVKLIDADEQESSYTWAQVREERAVDPPISRALMKGKIYRELMEAKEEGDCIVDVGGRVGPELLATMAACDVFVMPVVPGQFDTWALNTMIALTRQLRETGAKFQALAVLNATSPHPKSRSVANAKAILGKFADEFMVYPQLIVRREAFGNAVCEGKGVSEIEGDWFDPQASAEIKLLYAGVLNVIQ